MRLPDARHPAWGLAIAVAVMCVLGLMLAFNYNKVDERDGETMFTVAAAWMGAGAARWYAGRPSSRDDDQ